MHYDAVDNSDINDVRITLLRLQIHRNNVEKLNPEPNMCFTSRLKIFNTKISVLYIHYKIKQTRQFQLVNSYIKMVKGS